MARCTAMMPRSITHTCSFLEPASKFKTANDIFISIDISSAKHTICLWHKPHFTLCLTGFRVMENERVDYLFCNYISTAKNTPYILVNHEAMPLLHFCTPSFFQASSHTFAVNPITPQWTPVTLLPPLPSSWLCPSAMPHAIPGLLQQHFTIVSCQ